MSVSRNSITRLDASQFRRDAETGFLFAPVQPTRAGVFVYQDSSGKTVRELRDDADVFDPASLATLENAVITNSHPVWFQSCRIFDSARISSACRLPIPWMGLTPAIPASS